MRSVGAAVVFLLVSACEARTPFWTDPETGCQYIVGTYSVTPRLQADGKIICGKVAK